MTAAKTTQPPVPTNAGQPASDQALLAFLARCLPGLIIASELLFLFLCALLPLVAKAAWGGSGSPGAGPQPTRGVNIAFFIAIWLLTAATTGLAAYAAKCQADTLPADAPPARFPRPIAILAALLLLIAVAFSAGLLQL